MTMPSPLTRALIQEWTKWAKLQAPTSPQGKFLREQLLAALGRCGKEQHHMSSGIDSDTEDDYGRQQISRLYKKFEECMRFEEKYGHLIKPFRRLHYQRLFWFYGTYLNPQARVEVGRSVSQYHCERDCQFPGWRKLFEQRRAEKESSAAVQDGWEVERPRGEASETLRCLTYLVNFRPSEKVYDSLERWVLDGEDPTSEKCVAVEVVPRTSYLSAEMVAMDYEMCPKILGERHRRYLGDLRWAIDEYCRDVLQGERAVS
ncbi:hypothetical protein SCUP515_02787 [Seiridium cupressi]